MKKKVDTSNNKDLLADDVKQTVSELQQIRDALETLNQHKFVRLFNSTPRMLWSQFLRGMAFGLGSVMGATIVVSIVIALLAQIEFIPIIGEWTQKIIQEINLNH